MAKDDMQNSASQARVYKANTVHKRRAGKALSSHGEKRGADISSVEGAVESEVIPGTEVVKTAEAADILDSDAGSQPEPELEGEVKVTGDAVEPAEPAAEGASASDAASKDDGFEDWGDDSEFLQEDDGVDGEDASPKRKRRPADPRTLAKRVVLAIVAVLVILAVSLASYFAWDRWGRYDDVADIQGEWYIDGTATPIVIDGQTMQLAEDVAYNYEINPQEKTIRFWFGSWEGEGRYRFSDDRQRLLVIDGQYNGVGTLFDDLLVPFDAMATVGSQRPSATPQSESATAIDSVSPSEASDSAESQQASDQAASPVQVTEQPSGDAQGLGQDVSLFNRQADPEALKAKEVAEQAAKAQAEREAKAAAEAEAAEAAEYGYYDGYEEYDEYGEYDESSEYAYDEEGADEDDQSYSEDEEDWA